MTAEKFRNAYLDFLLTEGHEPASVYAFCKKLKTEEQAFYKHFASFAALEEAMLTDAWKEVAEKLGSDETYANYIAREKMLALFYAWFEKARSLRSYMLLKNKQSPLNRPEGGFIKGLRERFETFAKGIISEGTDNKEVIKRPVIGEQYQKALWIQFLFLNNFWLNDQSVNFSKTDAAVEKSVDLAFSLMGQTTFDSLMDFGKFMFENRR